MFVGVADVAGKRISCCIPLVTGKPVDYPQEATHVMVAVVGPGETV